MDRYIGKGDLCEIKLIDGTEFEDFVVTDVFEHILVGTHPTAYGISKFIIMTSNIAYIYILRPEREDGENGV